MLNLALGVVLWAAQLTGGGSLPQIVAPEYSGGALTSGASGEVTVALRVRDGYLINRVPSMQLEMEAVEGLELAASFLESSPEDPRATDEYYVDVPAFTFRVTAGKAGTFQIPGKLTYFFCSLADGFCSRQTIDVAIPIRAAD